MSVNGRPDVGADYGRLWVAVHDYLVAQAADPPDPTALAKAYAELVDSHNMIYRRYVEPNEAAELPRVEGV